MRQIESVLVALLAGPLTFVLTGRGLGGLAEVAAEAPRSEQTDYFAIVTAAAAVGLAGLLFALLTMARIAPLGPALAGFGFLAIGIWSLLDREQLLSSIPGDLLGLSDERVATVAAVSPLLAIPLLVTLCVPRRWRGRDRDGDRDREWRWRPGAAPPDQPPQ